MALVTSSQPSLIGGVSQQPEVLRPPSSAVVQDNAYSSVVDGLIKRHPMNHLTEHAWTTGFVHPINRDEQEKYFLLIDDAGLPRFIDTDGVEYTVFQGSGSNSAAYLTQGTLPARERYRAVTIADTTIVVNRDVTVVASPKTGDSPLLLTWRAFVYIKVGAFSTWYRIKLRTSNMAQEVSFNLKTWKGNSGTGKNDWTQIAANEYELRLGAAGTADGLNSTSTDIIAEAFAVHIQTILGPPGTGEVSATFSDGVLMILGLGGADFDPEDEDVVFEAEDGIGGAALVKCWTDVERLSDLPRTFLHDYRINVRGDESDNQDDFTVRFVGDSSTSLLLQEGFWEEFYEYGSTNRIGTDLSLPLKFVRKFNDSIGVPTGEPDKAYFEAQNFLIWDEKQAGNDETNPEPSFTGERINDVFFFENRLGFLSGQNVIMSGASGFFDFYMETMQAGLLDSDVIDVSAGHTSVAILRNAVPIGSALLLFSDLVQFQVVSGEDGILSPRTISLEPVATNESEPLTRPIALSGGLVFPFPRGGFSGVTEMVPSQGARGVWSYNTLSEQIPQYIEGDITDFAVDNRLGIIVVLADGATDKMYVFKEFQGPQGRLQAAWFRYTFTGSPVIRAINFMSGILHIMVERGAVTTQETMIFDASPVDVKSDFMVRLDRRITDVEVTSAVYDAATDETLVTFPYTMAAGEAPVIVSRADGTNIAGTRPAVLAVTPTTVSVRGDFSSTPFWAGTTYEMIYQFAKPQLRAQEGRGTSSIQTGRIQVMKGLLVHDGTGYFTVGVTLPTREEVVKSFGPIISGSDTPVGSLLFSQSIRDGRFSFHVMGNADDAVIVVRNDSPLPSNFQKAEWEIKYNSKATRFRG